jgi:metal-sulfur cluster biosynthetic enzyme
MKDDKFAKEGLTRELAIRALRGVIDPEVGINIVDLGLIYNVTVDADRLEVRMGLTSPACPMGNRMVEEARELVQAIMQYSMEVDVKLVWDPPWNPQMMSDKAKQLLGWR